MAHCWCAKYVCNPMVYVVCVCGLNACAYSVNWVRGQWVGGVMKGGIVIYSLWTDGNTRWLVIKVMV